MKTIGIDIGSYSIKIAELEKSGSSIVVVELHEHPLSQKPGVDKDLELITILKDILIKYDKEHTTFVLGLPQDKISTRSLFFPFKDKFKILKSLPFELEDLIPFSSYDAIFEGKIIKLLPNGSEVLSIAAPKKLIKSYLTLSSDIQINPKIISLEGFALNNLFEDILSTPPEKNLDIDWDKKGETEETSKNLIPNNITLENGEAILDVGHSSSTLIVRSSGGLCNIRKISWGALNLAKAMAKKKNIQEPEALKGIRASKGILLSAESGSKSDLEFSNILSNEIKQLGRVLKLTILEIKGVNSIDIKGIGLVGGLASLNNLGPKLTEFTLIPCNKVLKIKHHPEINIASSAKNKLSMGVAIGLALEAYRKPKNPAINFRREEFSQENSSLKILWKSWGFYINLMTASIVIFFIYSFLRSSVSEELAFKAKKNMKTAAANVFQIQKHSATKEKLKKLFTDLEKRESIKLKIMKKTKQYANAPLLTLKNISKKASSRSKLPMDITNLKINKNFVKIQGTTSAKNELQFFSNRLKSLSSGKISKTQRTEDNGNINFTISFKLKKGM